MPFLFREGLVFIPGDLALYKPDEQHKGEPCTVTNLISGKNNELEGYQITLDKGDVIIAIFSYARYYRASV